MSRSKPRHQKRPRWSLLPRWLSHRHLILSETVLVIGLVQAALNELILTHPSIPPLLRVLLGMMLVVGAFGWLIVWAHRQVQRTLSGTHRAVQNLPLPTPVLLIHLVVLGVLFLVYCWRWNDKTGAFSTLVGP